MVLSRVPNLQRTFLPLHSVYSHLDYLILSIDDLAPKNKTTKIVAMHSFRSCKFLFILSANSLGEYKIIIQILHQSHLSELKMKLES